MRETVQPTGDRALIKPLGVEKLTPGGLLIPETGRKKPCRGEVLAIGPGIWTEKGLLIEAGVSVGDVVLYSKHPISATECTVDGVDCLIMRPIDILGVVEDE